MGCQAGGTADDSSVGGSEQPCAACASAVVACASAAVCPTGCGRVAAGVAAEAVALAEVGAVVDGVGAFGPSVACAAVAGRRFPRGAFAMRLASVFFAYPRSAPRISPRSSVEAVIRCPIVQAATSSDTRS